MEWLHEQDQFWDKFSQELQCSLWGAEVWGDLSYYNNEQECQARLARYAEAVRRCLDWLNAHRAEVFAAIEEEGLYDDALEALENMQDDDYYTQTIEEDGRSYLLVEGCDRFPLPYWKEDFFNSLVPGSLTFSADHKSTEFTLDMFLDTKPEIFVGHSIEVFLDGDFSLEEPAYNITVNGLAG